MRHIQGYIINQITHYLRIDARYFLNGAIWLSLIQGITLIGSLLVSAVFANLLDESTYGTYRYVIGLGALFTALSLTGMGQAIFQASSKKHPEYYRYGNTKSIFFGAGITVGACTGALYYFYNSNIELALGCLIIALIQPFFNSYQQIFSHLQGSGRLRESTVLQGIKTFVVTASSIGAILLTQELFFLLLVYFLSNTITNFVVHLLYQPEKKLTLLPEVEDSFTRYAKNLSIQNIIANVAYRLDSIIVFQQLGATQLAIYTIATILPEQIKGSFKNVVTLLIPKYARHEDLVGIKKSMIKRSLQSLGVFSAITLLYIALAPFLYTLLFPKYHESIFLSQCIALSFPAMLSLIPTSALQAHLKQKELNALNMQVSLTMILTTAILTPAFGLIGAVVAKILSRYIGLMLSYYHLLKKEV